jgi:hypothetical protein
MAMGRLLTAGEGVKDLIKFFIRVKSVLFAKSEKVLFRLAHGGSNLGRRS